MKFCFFNQIEIGLVIQRESQRDRRNLVLETDHTIDTERKLAVAMSPRSDVGTRTVVEVKALLNNRYIPLVKRIQIESLSEIDDGLDRVGRIEIVANRNTRSRHTTPHADRPVIVLGLALRKGGDHKDE